MPSKTKTKNADIAARTAALPKIPKELLDQMVGSDAPMTAEQINAMILAPKKALIERALGGDCRSTWVIRPVRPTARIAGAASH